MPIKLSSSRGGLNDLDALEAFAASRGFDKPKPESKIKNVLRGVGRVLNIGTAVAAGATRGALDPEKSIGEGIKEGVKENIGFGSVIREDLGINPQSRTGKAAVGTIGFAADVLFDLITYLTFGVGAGLKVGGKILTKAGTRGVQKLAQGALKGATKEVQQELAGESAEEILERLGVQNIEKKIAAKAGTAEIWDKGGLKLFGKTLIEGEKIADSAVGKVGQRLAETELGRAVGGLGTAAKDTLGKMFVYGYGVPRKMLNLIEGGNLRFQNAAEGILKENAELFKSLSDDQMREFFDTVYSKKKEIVSGEVEIAEEVIGDLNKLFPGMKVTRENASRILANVEDDTIEQITKIRSKVEEIISPFFKQRQKDIKGGRTLTSEVSGLAGLSARKSLSRIDDLNRVVDDLKGQLSELRAARDKTARIGEGTDIGGVVTKDEMLEVSNRLIAYEEERLAKVVDDLASRLEKMKAKPGTGERVATPKLQKATAAETIVYAERLINKLQSDLTEKSRLLQKTLDSRKIAKARQQTERLVFDNPEMQRISDKLFEGEDALVKRYAKMTDLPEEEWIKFYIPSKFRDKLKPGETDVGKTLGINKDFQKKFKGVENDQLIRDPFEAYTRGQLQVTASRIKTDTADAIIKNMGRGIDELTELEAKNMGLVKWTRDGLGRKVEGWVPEDIAKELNKIFSAKKDGFDLLDDLARFSGFDYATGIFKGYVTSLFPGFHIRNLTSNQFQNMLKIGVNVANPQFQVMATDIALGRNLDRIITTKTGQKLTYRELRNLVNKESDILGRGKFSSTEQFAEVGETAATVRPGNIQKLNQFNPLSRTNVALQAGRKLGTGIEAKDKLVAIISEVVAGKGVKQGIKTAEEALFNYSHLTDFERTIMRRLIPFYTFARKNAELQITALVKTPGRVAGELKAMRSAGEAIGEPITEEDVESLPSFVLDSLGIKAGMNKFGQHQFLTGLGLPIEEFFNKFSGENSVITNFFKSSLEMTNPLVKFPLEKVTGVDVFRGRPITEITNADNLVGFFNVMPEPVANELKALLEFREIPNQPVYAGGKVVAKRTKYVANPHALHVLRNLPTSRIETTAGFITEEDQTPLAKGLRFLTGVKAYSIDEETQRFYKELKRKRQLQDWLIRMGYVKKFETVFEPKEKGGIKLD